MIIRSGSGFAEMSNFLMPSDSQSAHVGKIGFSDTVEGVISILEGLKFAANSVNSCLGLFH